MQIQKDFPFTEDNELDFIACTRYKSTDTNTYSIPLIKQDTQDFMVMTIGGNDIGFGDLAKACLYRPLGFGADCKATIASASIKIDSQDFKSNIKSVYAGLFDKMKKQYQYQVYQIGYFRFFYAETTDTDWCNDQSLGSTDVDKPKLTKNLRDQLNALSGRLNANLQAWAQEFSNAKMGGQVDNGYKFPEEGWETGRPRLFFIDPDRQHDDIRNIDYGLFDGHRFCEPGVEDPTFHDQSIWFFSGILVQDNPPPANAQPQQLVGAEAFNMTDPKTCANDPQYNCSEPAQGHNSH